jgi:rfaE bifunctional protein kinase chain/domain
MKKDLKNILGEFKDKKILVVGDIILDRTERGYYSDRTNPENQRVKIVNIDEEKFYLGGAANVASNVDALGAKSVLYGAIGKDIYGSQIKNLAEKGNVDISNLVEVENPTIVKARIFIDGKYKHRADLGEKNLRNIDEKIKQEMLFNINVGLKKFNAIILSDYNKHLFDEDFTRALINMAKRDKVKVFGDVKPGNIDYFKGAYIVSPNKKEASKITGLVYEDNPKRLFEMGKIISKKIGSGNAIITCGEKGAYVFDNGNSKMVSAKGKKIVEFTGAGDTFISTLALGNISGLNLFDSTELANYASGIVVGKEGTATTNIEEILKRIEEFS